jgi:chemotaxis protein methyltransferase CheR
VDGFADSSACVGGTVSQGLACVATFARSARLDSKQHELGSAERMTTQYPPQVIGILAALVEERAGLHYGLGDRELFADRVSTRALVAGFTSLLDYYYFLRYDTGSGAEFDALIDALVIGETYLFRELEPLQVLVSGFLLPAIAAGRRPRVWSAACATGEEPLSLAMLLAKHDVLSHVDLVASDISARSLARAAEGQLGLRALRGSPPAGVEPWLSSEGGRPVVAQSIRQAIHWCQVNLCDVEAVRALGTFDAILCRNVLIYFSDETTLAVVQTLADALTTQGILLVGISESLLRFGTALRCEEHAGVFLYRKAVD